MSGKNPYQCSSFTLGDLEREQEGERRRKGGAVNVWGRVIIYHVSKKHAPCSADRTGDSADKGHVFLEEMIEMFEM